MYSNITCLIDYFFIDKSFYESIPLSIYLPYTIYQNIFIDPF